VVDNAQDPDSSAATHATIDRLACELNIRGLYHTTRERHRSSAPQAARRRSPLRRDTSGLTLLSDHLLRTVVDAISSISGSGAETLQVQRDTGNRCDHQHEREKNKPGHMSSTILTPCGSQMLPGQVCRKEGLPCLKNPQLLVVIPPAQLTGMLRPGTERSSDTTSCWPALHHRKALYPTTLAAARKQR